MRRVVSRAVYRDVIAVGKCGASNGVALDVETEGNKYAVRYRERAGIFSDKAANLRGVSALNVAAELAARYREVAAVLADKSAEQIGRGVFKSCADRDIAERRVACRLRRQACSVDA